MNRTAEELFSDAPVMAILRDYPPREAVSLADRAWDLGIDLVEVPIQVPELLPSLKAVIEAGRERGKTVGAGTVISVEQLSTAEEAGAGFLVAPGLDTALVRESQSRGLPFLPGVATPTEVQQALRSGITWLKGFPASVLSPAWFSAMRGPFPASRFVATGGINAHNAPDFLAGGVSTVALGSALEDPEQLDRIAEVIGSQDSSQTHQH